jgi:hypothetical protein
MGILPEMIIILLVCAVLGWLLRGHKPLILWARKITGEKKHEEVRRFANRDFRVRWIGSGKDELLAHLRPFPDLH